MNTFPNIEFINFDTLENFENQNSQENNDIEMEYLNNFLLDKFDYQNECDNDVLTHECQSQMSFYSDAHSSRLNDSFCSLPTIDQMSCASESKTSSVTSLQDSPSVSPSESLDKNFLCDYENCNKKFKFKWILDRHYLSHKSSKLYKCNFKGCIKSYKSKENLTLHFKNIHLKEKPYSCRYCPSVFSHRNGKTYHERKFHTNYLPHKCSMTDCESTFASKSALTYHIKSQHSEKSTKKSNKMNRSKFNQEILKIVNEFEESTPDVNNFNNYFCVNSKH